MTKIGIIGGSGLDDPKLMQEIQEINQETVYGMPSSVLTSGRIGGVKVVVVARHGKKHQYSPTQVNNRANIQALKDVGVTHIIATTACGSLKQEIGRGDFVLLDQFIDFTRFRKNTFADSFENGPVHTPMAEPFNDDLRKIIYENSKQLELKMYKKGTVITIEGPRFSTKAESKMFITWGADVVNMSTAPEAMLAVEAGIPYAAIAMSTDYDCWKEDEVAVSWDEILKVFNQNAEHVKALLISAISSFKN
ncbi:MAG: S-methyl-5'-thioadenosine phosphorylase [Deltaproteobacteria bacterium]|jgi:5'-methylthioadenosine phosphorylase|nr:S-methyl-5'-thioadenosine phosphorylase [Deltaproteobacteria bacterium]MBT4528071.1 S-methyl-5'-thioadenosine phosphorylase [Deltaproteobacteria bacterium]